MTTFNEGNIKMLMRDEISREEFLDRELINSSDLGTELKKQLLITKEIRDAYDADILIYLVFKFKVYDDEFITLFNELLMCDWHEQHENLAMLLQRLKPKASVPYLYETALKIYDYLSFDINYALAVKCIWALGDIGSPEAREKLELLLSDNRETVRQNAKKQILRIIERSEE